MPKSIEQLTAEVDALEASIKQTQADMAAHLAKLDKIEAESKGFFEQVQLELRRIEHNEQMARYTEMLAIGVFSECEFHTAVNGFDPIRLGM